MNDYDVQLAWCLMNGERKHISDFEQWRGKLKDRPENLSCPHCNESVIFALSPERIIADHFKHKPDSSCIIRQGGESAAHLNAKIYLAELLALAQILQVEIKCTECRRICSLAIIQDYEVEVEYRIKTRRPDLAILENGQLALAIEIFHTHKVDREKIEDFSASQVKWIEITAEDAIALTRDNDQVVCIESQNLNACYIRHHRCESCQKLWDLSAKMERAIEIFDLLNCDHEFDVIPPKGGREPYFTLDGRSYKPEGILHYLDSELDSKPWLFNQEWDEIKFARSFFRDMSMLNKSYINQRIAD